MKKTQPTLKQLVLKYGNKGYSDVLFDFFKRIDNMIEVGYNILLDEFIFLSREIVNDYSFVSSEDLRLAMENGLGGKYGDFDECLSVNLVYRWMECYLWKLENPYRAIPSNYQITQLVLERTTGQKKGQLLCEH